MLSRWRPGHRPYDDGSDDREENQDGDSCQHVHALHSLRATLFVVSFFVFFRQFLDAVDGEPAMTLGEVRQLFDLDVGNRE